MRCSSASDQLWITITAIAVAYCVWNFFLRYPKDTDGLHGSTGGGTTTPPPRKGLSLSHGQGSLTGHSPSPPR